jgi:hypothetical protein
MNFDINSANDYVDDAPAPGAPSLPPSSIGKGGLSAIEIAGRGSPTAPKPNLGGLVSAGGQAQLEDTLYGRIRSGDQLANAKAERRGGLSSLQEALARPENNYSGIEHIARGMAHNEHPWDVGYGFRGGVAEAQDADLAVQKLKRDSGIESAKAGMTFNAGEEKIDDGMENNALNTLGRLARPIRGAGGAGAGGVRFKNVPGTGLVDTQMLDADGAPIVVYKDGKLLEEARKTAAGIAEKRSMDPENNITFKTDAERRDWVKTTTDQLAASLLAGTVPGTMKNAAGTATVPPVGSAPAVPPAQGQMKLNASVNTGGQINGVNANFDFKNLTPDMLNKLPPNVQQQLLATMQASGKDTSMFGNTNPDLSPDGSRKIDTPDVQKARNTSAEAIAKMQSDSVAKMRNDAETGMNMKSTVDELGQLKFNPGMFAKWKQSGGNLAEAFGIDGPIAKMAAQSGNAESLLQALSNARISLEHGVQTRDDEVRFKAELAKITDPREAYNYMLTHMKELGQKSIDHMNYYEDYRKNKGGGTSYDGADQAWQQENEDRGGMVKRYQGGFIGRSKFIDTASKDPANIKAFGSETAAAARAAKEWKQMGSK